MCSLEQENMILDVYVYVVLAAWVMLLAGLGVAWSWSRAVLKPADLGRYVLRHDVMSIPRLFRPKRTTSTLWAGEYQSKTIREH